MALNRLVMFPVSILLLLTIVAFFIPSSMPGTVVVPNTGGQVVVNLFGIAGFAAGMIMLITSMAAVDILAGIHILGSGISDASQTLLFKTVVWFGIWALMTISTSGILLSSGWTTLIYVALSAMFTIGLAFHLGGTASFPG